MEFYITAIKNGEMVYLQDSLDEYGNIWFKSIENAQKGEEPYMEFLMDVISTNNDDELSSYKLTPAEK